MTTPCECCQTRPASFLALVNRTTTGPGEAKVCGPCQLELAISGRGETVGAIR